MSRNPILRCCLLLIMMMTSISTAFAIEYTASGRVTYSGWSLDKDERREAQRTAMINVIESYISQQQPAHYKNYQQVKAQIDADIEAYILDFVITDDNQDKDSKIYEVSLRASINEPKLMAMLLSSVERDPNAEPPYLTFVFVAREVAGRQERESKSTSQTKSKEQGIGQDSSDNTAQRSKSQTQTIEIDSQETDYSDVLLYRASTANEIDVAMGNVFSLADYLVIDAALLEEETNFLLSVNDFISDYEAGNDLSPSTKSNALKGLRNLQDPIDYLAIGTLDIDEQQQDPQTGKYRIGVSVTGQVLSIKRRGAAMAKVGPVQYSAEGDTITMAKNNALKLAAEEAAQELVAILSSKNI
ncbi:hypothetical protein [Alteromonas facilis]|uniref:hypothetical protein n=1 Tax=Alteromonas facilis TaxID=2048004 RepID=UPI000C28D8E4|nr:hypothetical protein [Alteromonas facilis]